MPADSSLEALTRAAFEQAFGKPQRPDPSSARWLIEPGHGIPTINLILDRTTDGFVLWIFDPHDPDDTVAQRSLAKHPDIYSLIREVRQRAARAAAALPSRNGTASRHAGTQITTEAPARMADRTGARRA